MHSLPIVTALAALASELEWAQNSTRTALAHDAREFDCGDAATPGSHESNASWRRAERKQESEHIMSKYLIVLAVALTTACASNQKDPEDMSSADHEAAADQHDAEAAKHESLSDSADDEATEEAHEQQAEAHSDQADQHDAAADDAKDAGN